MGGGGRRRSGVGVVVEGGKDGGGGAVPTRHGLPASPQLLLANGIGRRGF